LETRHLPYFYTNRWRNRRATQTNNSTPAEEATIVAFFSQFKKN